MPQASLSARYGPLALISICLAAFWLTGNHLVKLPRNGVAREIEVVLPVWTQVLMTAGDRHLAANVAALRAVVVANEKMRPEEFDVLAKVQLDASWLNPAHEENYYTAAAILPWSGQLEAAQTILARATIARRFDYLPPFLYGFHIYHFKRDPLAAAIWLRDAAEHLPEDDNRLVLQNIAARWASSTTNLNVAIGVVQALSKQAERRDFRRYLERRVDRLRALQHLREAAERFRVSQGHAPATLDELVSKGYIDALPKDPFGLGFAIDARGEVNLKTTR